MSDVAFWHPCQQDVVSQLDPACEGDWRRRVSVPFACIGKGGRKELQQYLASKDIYATVIWGCPEEYKETIDEDSKYVYDHILCFHVDQRYDETDMNRILNVLKEYYKK